LLLSKPIIAAVQAITNPVNGGRGEMISPRAEPGGNEDRSLRT
jgi:hypothetical protein